MSNPLETSPQQKNKEQPDRSNRSEPDNSRERFIGELMKDGGGGREVDEDGPAAPKPKGGDEDREGSSAPKPNGAGSPKQSLDNYWGKPAADKKKEETSTETSPDGKVTITNKADSSYTTYDPDKESVIKVRDAKGAVTVPKGSGIEIKEPDGTLKTYSNGRIDIDGSVNFSTEDGTQHTHHIDGSRVEIPKDGPIKITNADGTMEELSEEANSKLSNLPYGQDAKIKSIIEKMTFLEANRAVGEIEGDLLALTNFSQEPFSFNVEANNPDNPFVNLNDLYKPNLPKFDLKNPLNDQQKIDLLKIHQERQRLQDQPLKGLSDLDKLRKEKEDFERDPFGLKRLPEISDKELKLQIQQEALGMKLTDATPEQRRQYEQRLAIERADRENPDASGSLSARLKVPVEQLTPQQKAIYDKFREVQDVRRAHEIVSKYIEQLQERRKEQASLERAQQSRSKSMFDLLPNLSLSKGNKTDAQQALGLLTNRDSIGKEAAKIYPNGLTVEPQSDGAYKVTLKDFSGNSEIYDISKDGKAVSARIHLQFSKSASDTFNKIGPNGKEKIEIETVKMESDVIKGGPEREAKLRSVYVLDKNREPVKSYKFEPMPGEENERTSKSIEDMNEEFNGDIGPDGKILPTQTGTVTVAPNGDLILDLKRNDSNPATKVVIKPDGTVSRLDEYGADDMQRDDTSEDEPAAAAIIRNKSADGHAEQLTHTKTDGEIIKSTLTRKGLKANTPIKALDGSLVTIGEQSLTIERKNDSLAPRKPGEMEKRKEGKVWTVDYNSGNVSLERNGGPALRFSTDAKTDSSPDKADNTLYRDEDYSDITQYTNEDHSRKITTVVLPEHKDATITVHTNYDTKNKTLDNVTITYKRKFKKEQ